jgi:hypothetical protein
MGFRQDAAGGRGANIKSLVTNGEREFKTLTFRIYHNTVKLTVSQLGTVRKIK